MRWFSLPHLRRKHGVSLERQTRRVSPGQRAASAALATADAALPEARGLGRDLAQAGAALRELRQRNHFAESMQEIYRNRGGRA